MQLFSKLRMQFSFIISFIRFDQTASWREGIPDVLFLVQCGETWIPGPDTGKIFFSLFTHGISNFVLFVVWALNNVVL